MRGVLDGTECMGTAKRYTEKALLSDASDLNHEAYKSGDRYFKAGKYKKAMTAFDEALMYWPKDPQAWMALGNCHDELKRPRDAERCFRRALAYCRPTDRDAVQFNLGNSLLDQARYRAAIQHYSTIAESSAIFKKAKKNRFMAEKGLRERTPD